MTGQKLDREEIMSHREHEAAMSLQCPAGVHSGTHYSLSSLTWERTHEIEAVYRTTDHWRAARRPVQRPSSLIRNWVPAVSVRLLAAILSLSAIGLDSTTIAASSALHVDQFRAVYEAPKDPAHQALYEELKAARSLERLREFLSFIRLPRVLTLKLAGCDGDDNAESRLKT